MKTVNGSLIQELKWMFIQELQKWLKVLSFFMMVVVMKAEKDFITLNVLIG